MREREKGERGEQRKKCDNSNPISKGRIIDQYVSRLLLSFNDICSDTNTLVQDLNSVHELIYNAQNRYTVIIGENGWFVVFYHISTSIGYLMPKSVITYILNIYDL